MDSESSESDSDWNSASEPEEQSDPDEYIPWRIRLKPKELTYQGKCSTASEIEGSSGQFTCLQLHSSEIDGSGIPLTPGFLFKLFFTPELVASICELTNGFAESQKELQCDIYKDWTPLTSADFYRFLSLLIFMTVTRVPDIADYWSESRLFGCLYSQKIMSRDRYKQIQAFLTLTQPNADRREMNYSEVDAVYELFREKCMKMWTFVQSDDHVGCPLDEVKDVVTFFWEGLDNNLECTSRCAQRAVMRNIKKTEKGWLLLEGFGKADGVQWKDRKVASALMFMHKDLKRSVLKFKRYKNLGGELGSAFNMAREFGSENAYLMVGENDVLISSTRAWKAVFYHLIDVAWLTSYLMFEHYRTQPERASDPHVVRLSTYRPYDFMGDLVEELAALPDDGPQFLCRECMPDATAAEERCARCVRVDKVVRKTNNRCFGCLEYYCVNEERNCLALAHGAEQR